MQGMQENIPNRICQRRRKSENKKAHDRDVCKWQRDTRYFPCFTREPKYSYSCVKKTAKLLVNVNPKYQNLRKPIKIHLQMDEMWGRVYCKQTPCWLWHAINHENGEVIAYVLGSREHEMLWELLGHIYNLNLDITTVYSDDNYAYHDIIPQNILVTGKLGTQKIERKHLTFRTRLRRLARKTICYSKSLDMHKIMVGLLINVLEFNQQLF